MPDPTPTQKMLANVRALRQQNAPESVIEAELAKWQPRIAEANQRDMAEAGSAGNLFARGLTSGFSDEIAGAADAVGAMLPGGPSPREAYRGTRDLLRETNDAYAAVNPGKALTAELAGGLVQGIGTGVGMARAVPGVLAGATRAVPAALTSGRTGARIAQAGLAGAAAGGLAGVGGADEMADVPRSAAIGATGGAVAGTLLGAAGAGVQGALRRTGVTAPRDPNTGNALARGAKAVTRAMGASTADDAAALRTVDVLERSGRSLDDVLDPARTLDRTATLADVDVGGNRAARLAGTARRLGETAADRADEVFGTRTAQRGVKLQGDLERLSGVGRFVPDDEAEALVQQARQAARPLYDQLNQLGPLEDPRIQEALTLIPEDRAQSFYKAVRDIARLEGEQLPQKLFEDVTDEAGQVVGQRLSVPFTPRLGNYFKQAMDEVLFSGSRAAQMGQPGGLTNAETRLLTNARQQLVQALDEGTDGLYAQARAAYAGPVSIREALESGRDLRNLDEGQLVRATRDLTPAQREAFNRGGVEATQRELAKMPEGRLGIPRNFTSPVRRAQTDAVLGPQAGPAWRELIDGEIAREQTEGIILRGSPTAERLADDEMGTLLTQNPGGLLKSLASGALQRGERALVRGSTAAEMDAVMRILSEPIGDVTTRLEVLALLQAGKTARAQQVAQAALRNAGVAGVVGGGVADP